MISRFEERFALPVEEIHSHFRTPADWIRLFGFAGRVDDLAEGWFAIPPESLWRDVVNAGTPRVLPRFHRAPL